MPMQLTGLINSFGRSCGLADLDRGVVELVSRHAQRIYRDRRRPSKRLLCGSAGNTGFRGL